MIPSTSSLRCRRLSSCPHCKTSRRRIRTSYSAGEGAQAPKGPAPRQQQAPVTSEARTFGNYAKETAYGVGRGLRDDVTGAASLIAHPRKTAADFGSQLDAATDAQNKEWSDTKGQPIGRRIGAAGLSFLEQAPLVGGMVQKAEQGGGRMASPEAVGAAAEGINRLRGS